MGPAILSQPDLRSTIELFAPLKARPAADTFERSLAESQAADAKPVTVQDQRDTKPESNSQPRSNREPGESPSDGPPEAADDEATVALSEAQQSSDARVDESPSSDNSAPEDSDNTRAPAELPAPDASAIAGSGEVIAQRGNESIPSPPVATSAQSPVQVRSAPPVHISQPIIRSSELSRAESPTQLEPVRSAPIEQNVAQAIVATRVDAATSTPPTVSGARLDPPQAIQFATQASNAAADSSTNAERATATVAAGVADSPVSDDPDSSRQESTGQQRRSQPALGIQATSAPTPAAARAEVVNAAVQLENATGSLPTTDAKGNVMTLAAPLLGASMNVHGSNGEVLSQQPQPLSANADLHTTGGIVRGLTTLLNQRGGVLNMRLDPPELGSLRVQMTIARGAVTAQFHPATAEAQATLERGMAMLRTALESHGLTVERLTVHAAHNTNTQNHFREEGQNSESRSQSHHHDAAGGQSRGRGEDDAEARNFEHRGSKRHAPFRNSMTFAQASSRADGVPNRDEMRLGSPSTRS